MKTDLSNIRTWSIEKLRKTANELIWEATTMRGLGEVEAERLLKKACVRLLAELRRREKGL